MSSDYSNSPVIYDTIFTDMAICDIRLENSSGQFTTFTSWSEDGSKPSLSLSIDMEDNSSSTNNNCTLKVYNLVLDESQYNIDIEKMQHWVKADIYWRTKPNIKTSFKFLVDPENIEAEYSGSDWVTTMKGTLSANVTLNSVIDPLVFADTNQICTSFEQFRDKIKAYYGFEINTSNADTEFKCNIKVTDRSPWDIFENEFMVKFFIKQGYFYRYTGVYGITLYQNSSDMLKDNVYCTIPYDALYKFAKSSTQIKISCQGLPGILKGDCFNISKAKLDGFGNIVDYEIKTYVVDEISVHYDDVNDGFTNDITATNVEEPKEPETNAEINPVEIKNIVVNEPYKAVDYKIIKCNPPSIKPYIPLHNTQPYDTTSYEQRVTYNNGVRDLTLIW